MSSALLYLGSVILALWGLGHLLATRGVAAGFADLTRENWRLFTMAWMMEGVALIFLGALVALVTAVLGGTDLSTRLVVMAVTVMLLVMAWITVLTGARTSLVPLRLGPAVKIMVAILFLIATIFG